MQAGEKLPATGSQDLHDHEAWEGAGGRAADMSVGRSLVSVLIPKVLDLMRIRVDKHSGLDS